MKMKRSHIIALFVIAAGIGVIISTAGDSSTYVTFKQAIDMGTNGSNTKVHVVGQLKKDVNGRIEGMEYKPKDDPNFFSFIMIDENNQAQKVVYYHPKPADFERSEKIVVVGSFKDETFIANKILMKCPSKYVEKEINE